MAELAQREVRLRLIEALSHMGVREPQRLLRDAKELEEYVMSGEDKAEAPARRGRQAE